MPTTLFLSSDHIATLVRRTGIDNLMDCLIERLERAFHGFDPGQCSIPHRTGFHYDTPHLGLVEWMPLMACGDRILMKMVGYHPENPETYQLPTILCTIALFDARSGHLIAIADGTLLTALRTGAASAVASRLLANPESGCLGLIGAGAQAVTQFHAISRLFPLRRVLVFDLVRSRAENFSERVAALSPDPLSTELVPPEEVVASAEILCTATSVEPGAGPVFPSDVSHQPCLHINAVGSDFPGKIEVPRTFLDRAFICPDHREQVEREGECQQLDHHQIGPELQDIAKAPDEFAPERDRLTVFDSTGFALEDFVALEIILELAEEHGIGTRLPFENIPSDPYNPYEGLEAAFQTNRGAPLEESLAAPTPS